MLIPSTYIPLIFVGIAVLCLLLFFKQRRKIRVYTTVTHILSFVFLFCVAGVGRQWILHIPMLHLIILVYFFLLGMWHTWSMYRFQSWSRADAYLAEISFTLSIVFFGGAAYLWTFSLVSGISPDWIMAGTLLPFLLPFLVHKSFLLWKNIPDKIYYIWQYSERLQVPEPPEGDSIIIHFAVSKRGEHSQHNRYTVKAPLNMKLGDIFHHFLRNYNAQYPDKAVLANSRSTPFGWYFYTKDAWWKKKEAVNPNISIYRNQLSDNILIYAKRIYLGY